MAISATSGAALLGAGIGYPLVALTTNAITGSEIGLVAAGFMGLEAAAASEAVDAWFNDMSGSGYIQLTDMALRWMTCHYIAQYFSAQFGGLFDITFAQTSYLAIFGLIVVVLFTQLAQTETGREIIDGIKNMVGLEEERRYRVPLRPGRERQQQQSAYRSNAV